MKISGIYKIQSIIKPERVYIGSAINIHDRWIFHKWNLRKNIHHSKKLQNHYNKYGESDLQFSVLSGCEKEKLIEQEQFYIDAYKPYFNIRTKAENNLGMKWSLESIEKSRLGRTGQKRSDEQRKTMSENHADMSGVNNPMYGVSLSGEKHWNYGNHSSKESRKKMSDSHKAEKNNNYGKHFSDEHKQKISQSEKQSKAKKLLLQTSLN